MLGKNGLIPGNTEYAASMGDDVYAKAAVAAALNAKLTPAAENWADGRGRPHPGGLLPEARHGRRRQAAAAAADKQIEAALN